MKYVLIAHINDGGCSDIYVCKKIEVEENQSANFSQKLYVAKISGIKMRPHDAMPPSELLHGEAEILRELTDAKVEGISKYCDFANLSDYSMLIMNYIRGRELFEIASDMNYRVEPFRVKKWMIKIAKILLCVHPLGIIHRDIKMENILIDGRDEPHVIDWGFATFIKDIKPDGQNAVCGTLESMAPETYDRVYGTASDVWSLGVVLYNLLTRVMLFTVGRLTYTKNYGFFLSIDHKNLQYSLLPYKHREYLVGLFEKIFTLHHHRISMREFLKDIENWKIDS